MYGMLALTPMGGSRSAAGWPAGPVDEGLGGDRLRTGRRFGRHRLAGQRMAFRLYGLPAVSETRNNGGAAAGHRAHASWWDASGCRRITGEWPALVLQSMRGYLLPPPRTPPKPPPRIPPKPGFANRGCGCGANRGCGAAPKLRVGPRPGITGAGAIRLASPKLRSGMAGARKFGAGAIRLGSPKLRVGPRPGTAGAGPTRLAGPAKA